MKNCKQKKSLIKTFHPSNQWVTGEFQGLVGNQDEAPTEIPAQRLDTGAGEASTTKLPQTGVRTFTRP